MKNVNADKVEYKIFWTGDECTEVFTSFRDFVRSRNQGLEEGNGFESWMIVTIGELVVKHYLDN